MEEKWLKQLVAPGSSLGGARPKASVAAPDGPLWIAKFPSKYDEINVGASPQKDLLELWRRMVFNMAVSNTDDHLRNHGFIMVKNGWILSPLYDVNPNIYGDTLSLNVDSDNNLIDFNLALSVAKMYGLTRYAGVRGIEGNKTCCGKQLEKPCTAVWT